MAFLLGKGGVRTRRISTIFVCWGHMRRALSDHVVRLISSVKRSAQSSGIQRVLLDFQLTFSTGNQLSKIFKTETFILSGIS